jgi:hypothetical protein
MAAAVGMVVLTGTSDALHMRADLAASAAPALSPSDVAWLLSAFVV